MKVKCFLTREDALVYPEADEEFRYENGWPFLEIIKKGNTSKLINKNSIVEMEIVEPTCENHGTEREDYGSNCPSTIERDQY